MSKFKIKNKLFVAFLTPLSLFPLVVSKSCNKITEIQYYSKIILKDEANLNNLSLSDFVFEGLDSKYEIIDFKASHFKMNNMLLLEFKIQDKATKKILKEVVTTLATIQSDNIDEIAKRVIVDVVDKEKKEANSINTNDLIFSNYNTSVYKIVEENIELQTDKKSIKITFKLQHINNSEISTLVSKIITGFKESSLPIPNPVNIEYDSTNNYYSHAEGLKGAELFAALYNKQKSKISGIGSYADLYKTYKTAFVDKYFEKNNTILDVYSENPYDKDPYEFKFDEYDGKGGHPRDNSLKGKEGWMYNREHMIPQSWFNYDNKTKCDAHFVWPTDKMVNQWRSNNPHYEITNGKVSKNGTKWNSSYCEPIDYFKGDIARAYFYFQITHQNGLSDNGRQVFKDVFPFFHENFLKTYQKWQKNDPVDIIEIDRNNAIAKAQNGLRNPFIDYPDLVELIWGNTNKVFHNLGVAKGIK